MANRQQRARNPPPAVNDEEANGILDEVFNDGHTQDINTHVDRAKKRAKVSKQLNGNRITQQEQIQQEQYAFHVQLLAESETAFPDDPNVFPPWFACFMAQQQEQRAVEREDFQRQQQHFLEEIQRQRAEDQRQRAEDQRQRAEDQRQRTEDRRLLGNMNASLKNVNARILNGMITQPTDQVHAVSNANGDYPRFNAVPRTLNDLNELPGRRLLSLVRFYGLPEDPINTRSTRLKSFLGFRFFQ